MSNELEKVRDIAKNGVIDGYLVGMITGGAVSSLVAAMMLGGPLWIRVLMMLAIALGAWGFAGVFGRVSE